MGMGTVVGTLEFAKVLMSVFIMVYAYYFLRRSENLDERKPWEYLYIASMFLFLVEFIRTLQLFKFEAFNSAIITSIVSFVEFAFISFLLFSFIFQHNMIIKRKKIVIEEKPMVTFWDKLLGWLNITKKKMESHDHDITPEEELKEELSEMDIDQELKKDEEEIEQVLGEAELRTEEEVDIIHLAENLVSEAEELLIRHGDTIDAAKAESLKADLEELKTMLETDRQEIDLIEKKVREILGHD